MVINVALKYIFIFVFKLGVSGAALSTLAAYIIAGTVQVKMHCSHKNRIFVIKLFKPEWYGGLIGRITKIALPNGIENGLFKLGALILQRLVSTLGTASIAANALASNISRVVLCHGNHYICRTVLRCGRHKRSEILYKAYFEA